MSLKDRYDFSIIENSIKESVIETLEVELENSDNSIADREDVVIDIVCYALNRLKPNYTASLLGSLYSKVNAEQRQEEVTKVVREAIERIAAE